MGPVRRTMRALAAAAAACVAASGPDARSDAGPTFEYVRDKNTIDSTVKSILARAGADSSVLFVFDAASFDPPPGRNEFTVQYRFSDDLPKWVAAIRDAGAATSSAAWVAASTSDLPLAVGSKNWDALLDADLYRKWWDDRTFAGFQPAHVWTHRLLAGLPGKRKALAVVSGEMPPEKWIREPPFDPQEPDVWRRKLLPRGRAWDEEAVGAAVAADGARLFVVAPESRFSDFLPLDEVPAAPWASRPRASSSNLRRSGGGRDGTTSGPRPRLSDSDAAAIAARLRAAGASEEEVRAAIDRIRRAIESSVTSDARDASRKSRRFGAATPLFFPRYGRQVAFNTDVRSGYGEWRLARAAAKAGGAYFFYPFPPSDWADVCPRSDDLLDAMAPELVPVTEFAKLRSRDGALAAMLDAQRIVFRATPWRDGSRGGARGGASSWCGFEDSPERVSERWSSREKPWDSLRFLDAPRSPGEWRREGGKLAAVLKLYDRAIRALDAAQQKLDAGRLAGATRRSAANLRLCRFWFEMSAFHLDALRIYLSELPRFVPPSADTKRVTITYTPAIKMSDCLDAYDGRTVEPRDEALYGHVGPDVRDCQGWFLNVPREDPNYRARRFDDAPLFRLDPRLLPRAFAMIDAARDVVAHDAKSAWGWVVYYSEADTFTWNPAPLAKGPAPQSGHGSGKTDSGPETPPSPPTVPGSDPTSGPGTPK